jgi:SAM-dependent methyltransferase
MKMNQDKIIQDNLAMHNRPGYARFYDRELGIVKSPWERRIFLDRIDRMVEELRREFSGSELSAVDLGAGTGNLALPLLKAGVAVTAVDLSRAMLDELSAKHVKYSQDLTQFNMECLQADEFLDRMIREEKQVHLVCACSFYHHLPDYLATLARAARIVRPGGFLFLAHEPMRKDTVYGWSRRMQWVDFKFWRVKVHLRKLFDKKYSPDEFYDPESLADYWDLTTGCDQERMTEILNEAGFETALTCYDSKRSKTLHHLCRLLHTQSLFMIVAKKV